MVSKLYSIMVWWACMEHLETMEAGGLLDRQFTQFKARANTFFYHVSEIAYADSVQGWGGGMGVSVD